MAVTAAPTPRTLARSEAREAVGPTRPVLRVVPAPRPTRAMIRRRRVGALSALVVTVWTLGALVGRVTAQADLAERVAGHVVVAPGETLWDVAVATAPPGTDARAHLAAIRELNGLGTGTVAPWTVVLLPAR